MLIHVYSHCVVIEDQFATICRVRNSVVSRATNDRQALTKWTRWYGLLRMVRTDSDEAV